MTARFESTIRRHAGRRFDRGFSLLELIISLSIVLVVAGGMAAFYGVSTRANGIDKLNVQLLNSARAKIEQIQSIPYGQVGIHSAVGASSGEAYFEIDPYNTPEYGGAVLNDLLLSDTITLRDGTVVTRTVTILAVDDPADGIGSADSDGTIDPNTLTILDYKTLTVTTSATVQQSLLTQTLTTVLQGSLAVEIEGATGVDAPADVAPTKIKTVKAKTPPKGKITTPPDCGIVDPPKGKSGGKDGAAEQSEC